METSRRLYVRLLLQIKEKKSAVAGLRHGKSPGSSCWVVRTCDGPDYLIHMVAAAAMPSGDGWQARFGARAPSRRISFTSQKARGDRLRRHAVRPGDTAAAQGVTRRDGVVLQPPHGGLSGPILSGNGI